MAIESGLSRHTMLATPKILIQFCFYHLTSEDIRHYVLAYLNKKAQSVGYSTNIDTVLFYHLTSEDSRHYVLANLL